jgi:hypothetical protein
MTSDAHEQQPRWYFRRSGEIVGPLSTSRLEELLRQQALGDRDEVRLETEAAWMPVADVRRMFADARSEGDNAEDAPVDAAHAAAAALSKSARAHLLRPAGPPRVTRRTPSARPNPIAVGLGALVELAATFTAAVVMQVLRVFRLQIVQVAILAVLVGVFVWQVVLPRIPIPSDAILAQYQQLWHEIRAARDQTDGTADWESLERRIAATVAETKPHLTVRSSPSYPEHHELVLVADLLPVVAQEAKAGEQSTRNEHQLISHLAVADQQLAGAPPPLLTRLHVMVLAGWAVVAALVLLWMLPVKTR